MAEEVVQKFKISRYLDVPGGISLADAVARGEENIEAMRGRSMGAMAEAIANIDARLRALPGEPCLGDRREMHRLACLVISLGGTFGRGALSQAAYSLCRLLDETEAAGRWARAAADVHVAAMRLFIAAESHDAAAEERVLNGLVQVRQQAAR